MVSGYVPPPPPAPAEIQTIDADQQQRIESPEQSAINDINQGRYGDNFTASNEQPEQAKPDESQQMQDMNDSVEGIGQGAAALAEAKNQADQRKEEDAAITGNRDVAAGTGGEPPPDPEKAAGKAASEQGNETTPDQGQSNDSGDHDYYNGYGY